MTESQDIILCPSVILKLRLQLTVLQMRILVAIIVRLQWFILQQVNGRRRQGSHLYPADKLIQGHVAIQLPLSLIMGAQKNYVPCRNALQKMRDTLIGIPVGQGFDSHWEDAYPIDVIFPKDKSDATANVYIHHTIADRIFDISTGYFRFSRAAFLSCSKSCTQMMYLFCEQWRNHGIVHMSTHSVVTMLGSSTTYRRFSAFRRKKLDVAAQELKSLYRERIIPCYFSYRPNYAGSNLSGEPSTITFHIYDVKAPAIAQYSDVQLQAAISTLLIRHFQLYPVQAKNLAAQVDQWNYLEVVEKLHELKHRLRSNKNIRDQRAYAYTVITRFLADTTPTKKEQPTEELQLGLTA